jgi:hypothetical protein
MARYHNRYKPHRNPVPLLLMGAPMLPLAAAVAGLYFLSKGAQRNPGNPVAGGLGEMGSLFSNVFQTAGQAIKESIANPIEVAIRVAAAPIKLATGSSWSSQVASIKAPFQQAAATARSASPSAIRSSGSAPAPAAAPACAMPNVYTDANGNALTYAQYVGLMTAQGLTPANDDCSGSADAVPPSADPDMTQTSNSVIQDPNQPGGLPGAPGAGKGKGKGGKGAAASTGVNPLMVAGGGAGVLALMYFMNK